MGKKFFKKNDFKGDKLMKKLLWKRMLQRLSMCMTGVLLELGIAIVVGGATPVQAAKS